MDTLGQLRKIGLPQGSYVVFGSAVLERLGIRKAADLDVVVNEEGAAYLAKHFPQYQVADDKYHIGGIELVTTWPGVSVAALFAHSEVDCGMRYASIDDFIRSKQLMARPKDVEDLRILGVEE